MGVYRYWGKTSNDGNYHLLPYHCLDVAAVGNALFDANETLLVDISTKLGMPLLQCRSWLLFFLAFHDIGKFATSFQNQNRPLFTHLQQTESPKKYTTRHDSLGFFCRDKKFR
jgi:CRISPR-associated endonuclease/helicase Cas3